MVKGENAGNHEVLRVSYCDWSVVRLSVHPSVRSQLQKNSSSPKLDFNQTSQK